ncbi:peptidase S8, partial [filamentous cyanobacterium CCP1]
KAFGYGMVNALRAVLAAQQQVKPRQVVSRWIEQQVTIPVDIPDGDPQGIFTSIHIDAVERVCQIEVSVEIEHSFMGDLEIYLLPPNGTSILLQPRTAGRVNILRKTYTSNTTPLLESALNQPARGKWQLQLVDRVLMHTGRLKRWGLKVGV